jgi:hypothetical protein
MANKQYFPLLDCEAKFPSFAPSFQAFAATERLSRIFRDGTVRPALAANNAAQEVKDKALAAQVKFDEDDERGYGFLVLALEKVPLLRNKLLALPAVRTSPASGMVLWRALRAEILNNPNRSVYIAILEQIDMYSAKDIPVPDAIHALDSLYAMLPADLLPTDSAKCLQLRHSLPKHYADTVHTASIANPLATYSSVCESLLAEYRSQIVLDLKKPTLESDAIHLATSGKSSVASSPSSSTSSHAEEANYSSAVNDRGRPRYNNNNRSSSRSPGRYDGQSNYYNGGHSSSYRNNNNDYRSRSRDRSRSRERHAPVSFRGGRRAKSPNAYRSRSPHKSVRFTPSPARGILKSSSNNDDDIQCHRCKGRGHKANICPTKQ